MTVTPVALRSLRFALAAVEQDPASAAAWYAAGRARLAVGQTAEGVQALQKAVSLAPSHAPAWRELGVALASLGWMSEPIRCFRSAVQAAPNDADAWTLLAQALLTAGDLAGAEAPARTALDKRPHHPDAVATLARIELRRGALDAAAALLAPHVPTVPIALVAAELAVARCAPGAAVPALRAAIAESTGLDRVRLLHALGDVFDAAGAHDDAFAAYRDANDARTAPVDAAAILADANARIVEPPGTLAGPPLRRMVWIVGLPRAGTGLVERLLAAHPRVGIGRERSPLPELEAALHRGTPLTQLAQSLRRSVEQVDPSKSHVIDRLPDNARRLGLAAQVAPGCTVIHVTRDPLDTLWACYRQCYSDALAWTTRLDGLAATWRAHDRLMTHWRESLPQMGAAWIEVKYESLVARPDHELRRLLLALNLPLDPACFAPAGLHRKSIGRAAPYRAHLAPVTQAIGGAPG